MATSDTPNFPKLINRRDRQFNMAWYKLDSVDADGNNVYVQHLIPRVKKENARGVSRQLDGYDRTDELKVTIEHRDTKLPTGFNTTGFEKDFIILYQHDVPAADLTPQTATDAGHKAWSVNGVQFLTGVTGRVDNTVIRAA